MKRSSIAAVLVLFLATLGCNKQTTSQTASNSGAPAVQAATNLTPEELGELGAKIKKHPGDAQKLLGERGLDEAAFERAVRKVAESPDESKRYAAAYKKAS